MGMHVLIVVVIGFTNGDLVTVTTQEFTNRLRCETAESTVKRSVASRASLKTACVRG